jgi:hypothetical protein
MHIRKIKLEKYHQSNKKPLINRGFFSVNQLHDYLL